MSCIQAVIITGEGTCCVHCFSSNTEVTASALWHLIGCNNVKM